MATKKKSKPRKISGALVFWVVFFITIIILFLVNMDKIQDTLQSTGFIGGGTGTGSPDVPVEDSGEPGAGPGMIPVEPGTAPQEPGAGTAPIPQALPETSPSEPARTAPENTGPETPAATRERALYFIQVDGTGAIVRTKISRLLPVSDSPLLDTLQSLIQGPTAGESREGLLSVIPPGTILRSVAVQGATAYINFSEDFMFNTKGLEGYMWSVRQLVWTATEFSTVQDVQILIDGQIVDYLGEGIRIGIPLSRETL